MMFNGSKDVAAAGTAETLASDRTAVTWIIVQAKSTNTGRVYVGSSTVASTNGVSLLADDSKLWPPVADLAAYDLSLIYVDADVNGEGVTFEYFRR
jgi:hypothetical protein